MARMKHPAFLFLGALAAAALVVVALVLLIDGGKPGSARDGSALPDGPTAAASSVPGTSVTATEGPLLGPIDDGFVQRELALGEVPEGHGIVFVNAETAEAELWTHPIEGAPGDDFYAFYATDAGHRWLQVRWAEPGGRFEPSIVIADRETGDSFRLDTARWNLVAGPTPDGLLIAQSRTQADSFSLVDLAEDPTGAAVRFSLPLKQPVLTGVFEAEAEALVLGDATTLLLAIREIQGEPGKPGDWRFFRIDTASGEAADLDISRADMRLSGTDDGGAVIVTPAGEDGGPTAIYRFDGSGNLDGEHSLQAAVSGYNVQISPDGRWITWLEQLPLQVQSGVGLPWHWPATMLADLETGEVVLRLLRADPLQWLGDSGAIDALGGGAVVWQQWQLGDATGLLVKTAGTDCRPECVYAGTGSPGSLALLSPDGALQGLSIEPDWQLAAEMLVGDRLGLNGGGNEVRVERWVRPGGDGGGGISAMPIPPHVQRPPFPDDVRLRVAAAGDGLNLRESPSTNGGIVVALPDEGIVTVSDAPCPEPEHDVCSVTYEGGDSVPTWWVHVTTQDGREGWVAAEFLAWAD